ncbi:MAG TPA: OmpA family protein [Thermoanaerobaculia bacterium]|nr:OmpA family protein [Thermoanaerobaculia bacterium]
MKRLAAILLLSLLALGCISASDPAKNEKKNAGRGALIGAIAGAIIGNQSGNSATGAVVGAIAGAAVGGAVGRRMDEQERELEQIEGVEVTRTSENELNVTVDDSILFDYDSYELRPDARATLSELAAVFARYPETRLLVEGHTDASGSEAYNQLLSERRAESVSNDLIERGVDRARIEMHGYGKSRPVADNATPEGRQLNRRVEIQVIAQ